MGRAAIQVCGQSLPREMGLTARQWLGAMVVVVVDGHHAHVVGEIEFNRIGGNGLTNGFTLALSNTHRQRPDGTRLVRSPKNVCVCTKMYEAPSANRVCGSHWAAASACSEVLFSTLSILFPSWPSSSSLTNFTLLSCEKLFGRRTAAASRRSPPIQYGTFTCIGQPAPHAILHDSLLYFFFPFFCRLVV